MGISQDQGVSAPCRDAFLTVLRGLHRAPSLDTMPCLKDFFLEETHRVGPHLVWKFAFPPAQLTANWIPFLNRADPLRTFLVRGRFLFPHAMSPPAPLIELGRIVALVPRHSKHIIHGGLLDKGE